MDSESNRELDGPSDEAERIAEGDDRQQAAEGAETRSEPADGAMDAATQGQGGERPRLPSIDDYDWEQQIERIARRLSPHRPPADEADDDGVEEEPLRPAADAPASLRRAADAPARLRVGRYGAAEEVPHWQEPVSRRPVARVLAVTVPVLAIAAAWPFVQGVPAAWTDGLGWLPGNDKPVTGVIFQPSPHAPAVLPLSLRDAPRQASRAAATAFALGPLHGQTALPSAGLALAAARERQALAAGQPSVTQARAIAAPRAPAPAAAAAAKPPSGPPAAADRQPAAEPDIAGSAAPKGDLAAEPDIAGSAAPKGDLAAPAHGPEVTGKDTAAAESATPESDLAAPARSPEVTSKDAGAVQQASLRTLSEREIEDLLARGHELLEIGDIASARLLFQLVAEAGDPRGAKAMGMTFDPSVFAELPVAGMAHDRAQAEIWYDRSDAMPALSDPADGADAEGAVRAAENSDGNRGRRGAR